MKNLKVVFLIICLTLFFVGCSSSDSLESKKSDRDIEIEHIEENLRKFVDESKAVYLDQYDYNYTIELQELFENKNMVIREYVSDIYKYDGEITAVIIRNQIRYELDCTTLYDELLVVVSGEDYNYYSDNYAYLVEIESFDPKNVIFRSEGEVNSDDDYYFYSDLGQLVIVKGRILKIENLLKN